MRALLALIALAALPPRAQAPPTFHVVSCAPEATWYRCTVYVSGGLWPTQDDPAQMVSDAPQVDGVLPANMYIDPVNGLSILPNPVACYLGDGECAPAAPTGLGASAQ